MDRMSYYNQRQVQAALSEKKPVIRMPNLRKLKKLASLNQSDPIEEMHFLLDNDKSDPLLK